MFAIFVNEKLPKFGMCFYDLLTKFSMHFRDLCTKLAVISLDYLQKFTFFPPSYVEVCDIFQHQIGKSWNIFSEKIRYVFVLFCIFLWYFTFFFRNTFAELAIFSHNRKLKLAYLFSIVWWNLQFFTATNCSAEKTGTSYKVKQNGQYIRIEILLRHVLWNGIMK